MQLKTDTNQYLQNLSSPGHVGVAGAPSKVSSAHLSVMIPLVNLIQARPGKGRRNSEIIFWQVQFFTQHAGYTSLI